jgi:hypothetical protein
MISAALVTGLNSDLPGQVIAQVTEDVYDSVSGRYLLGQFIRIGVNPRYGGRRRSPRRKVRRDRRFKPHEMADQLDRARRSEVGHDGRLSAPCSAAH